MHDADLASPMDAERIERVADELVAWGVLERAPALAPTRRFRAALARAAASLQAREAAGEPIVGSAIQNVVEVALAAFPLPEGARPSPEHRKLLMAIELASLPEGVRSLVDP